MSSRINLRIGIVGVSLIMAMVYGGFRLTQGQVQNPSKQNIASWSQAFADLPILDLSSETGLRHWNATRLNRGLKYDIKEPGVDIASMTLSEDSRAIFYAYPGLHEASEPAFPISASDVIIIGKVTSAIANLSNDGTAIYSEFEIQASKLIQGSPVLSDKRIIAERRGGGLRFASGKTVLRPDVYGRNPPKIGSNYLLFLRSDILDGSHYIITGYQLNAKSVLPLDFSPEGIGKFKVYAEYERNINRDLGEFMNEFNSALRKSFKEGE